MVTGTWQAVEKYGKSKLLKTAYFWIAFVPIVCKFLSFIQSPQEATILGIKMNLSFELPFSWQVFFFSSLSFVAANVIYQLRCPDIIKNFNSFEDFAHNGGGNLLLGKYFETLAMESKRDISKSPYYSYSQIEGSNGPVVFRKGDFGSTTQRLNELRIDPDCFSGNSVNFANVRLLSGHIRAFPLGICILLYATGFTLLGLLVYQNTAYVVHHTTIGHFVVAAASS